MIRSLSFLAFSRFSFSFCQSEPLWLWLWSLSLSENESFCSGYDLLLSLDLRVKAKGGDSMVCVLDKDYAEKLDSC